MVLIDFLVWLNVNMFASLHAQYRFVAITLYIRTYIHIFVSCTSQLLASWPIIVLIHTRTWHVPCQMPHSTYDVHVKCCWSRIYLIKIIPLAVHCNNYAFGISRLWSQIGFCNNFGSSTFVITYITQTWIYSQEWGYLYFLMEWVFAP